ncbi:MAG: hypothetical protein IJT50_16310 [Lentisphaeria bacterium]|nr:hypothetical protein [Lentisphaeria bacterium]
MNRPLAGKIQRRISLLLLPALLLAGCAPSYIGKTREEIVGIIAAEYRKKPGPIYIRVSPTANAVFDDPGEILDPNRTWGRDMRKLDQWGILPYEKPLVDGSYFTLLTFRNDRVVKEEECRGGGYGFLHILLFSLLYLRPLFGP